MKRVLIKISLSIFSILVIFLFAEAAAQIYVHYIAKQGKIFEPDRVAGWRLKPDIQMQRKNADGSNWTIRTDENSIREKGYWDSNMPKVLVLGDSFAFGEGVQYEDRFDRKIEELDYTILNVGVMGYGTDQQLLKAKPHFAELGEGDVVIILTYYNDFYDIIRKQHSGRAKPWYEYENEKLELHEPEITIKEVLRDKSYLFAMLGEFLSRQHEASDSDIERSSRIYQELIKNEAEGLAGKGVVVLVAYHGISLVEDEEQRDKIIQALKYVCRNSGIRCLNIDEYFNIENSKGYFLSDGHWNQKGHKVAGELLADKLSSIIKEQSKAEY